jgi:hypothetical protein
MHHDGSRNGKIKRTLFGHKRAMSGLIVRRAGVVVLLGQLAPTQTSGSKEQQRQREAARAAADAPSAFG